MIKVLVFGIGIGYRLSLVDLLLRSVRFEIQSVVLVFRRVLVLGLGLILKVCLFLS